MVTKADLIQVIREHADAVGMDIEETPVKIAAKTQNAYSSLTKDELQRWVDTHIGSPSAEKPAPPSVAVTAQAAQEDDEVSSAPAAPRKRHAAPADPKDESPDEVRGVHRPQSQPRPMPTPAPAPAASEQTSALFSDFEGITAETFCAFCVKIKALEIDGDNYRIHSVKKAGDHQIIADHCGFTMEGKVFNKGHTKRAFAKKLKLPKKMFIPDAGKISDLLKMKERDIHQVAADLADMMADVSI